MFHSVTINLENEEGFNRLSDVFEKKYGKFQENPKNPSPNYTSINIDNVIFSKVKNAEKNDYHYMIFHAYLFTTNAMHTSNLFRYSQSK